MSMLKSVHMLAYKHATESKHVWKLISLGRKVIGHVCNDRGLHLCHTNIIYICAVRVGMYVLSFKDFLPMKHFALDV